MSSLKKILNSRTTKNIADNIYEPVEIVLKKEIPANIDILEHSTPIIIKKTINLKSIKLLLCFIFVQKEIFLNFEYMYEKTNPKTTNTMITYIMIPL